MIRKFATIPGFRIVQTVMFVVMVLAGTATVQAQQAPAQQAPAPQPSAPQPSAQPPAQPPADAQQSGSQEASEEESSSRRKIKPKDYKNWTFNVGGGAAVYNGTTKIFVRGGGGVAAGGVARNLNKYFGLRADFQFDNLPLRNSTLELAQAPGASDHVYSLMVDPIINVPATKVWSGYIVFGPSYYHRSGKLDSSTAIPGSACTPFFTWWGRCYAGSLPVNGNFLTSSQNEFGYNLGGGLARKVTPNIEIYAEFRYMHGKHNGITTDLRPITIGVRW